MPGVDIFDPTQLNIDIETKRPLIFRTASEFSEYIEVTAYHNDLTVTQMLLDYCEIHDIEYEELGNMLTPTLKNKIACEMQESGFMPKTSQLAFE